MKDKSIWTFRTLFVLSIIYHIWSYTQVGFGAFAILKFNSLILTILASAVNYLIQIGLPLLFLYFSFSRKDMLAGRIKVKDSIMPRSFLK